MVNSVWKSSTSSPVFSGLRELYFAAPFADTVRVTLCGVKLLHKRSNVIEGAATEFWPAPAEEFCSSFCAGSVCTARKKTADNNSQRKITLPRLILKLLGNGYSSPPCEGGKWQWPARRRRPSVPALRPDSG